MVRIGSRIASPWIRVLCIGTACCGTTALAQTYQLRDLDPTNQLASGFCSRTTISGVTIGGGAPYGAPYSMAVYYDASGSHVLPVLAGDEAGFGADINSSLTMVGSSTDVVVLHHLIKFTDHPAMWQNGQVTDIRSLVVSGPSLDLIDAVGINDAGTIVGLARDPATQIGRAYRLENGVLTDLGFLAATPSQGSTPTAIGMDGSVVGSSTANGGFHHAVLWQNGQIVDLHAQAQIPGRVSEAFDINRFGVIVGGADYVADFQDFEVATVWVNGVATNLGTLGGPGAPPVVESFARAINDLGVIVGTSVTLNYEVHACIWRNGSIADLNTLIPPGSGWLLANAYDIDNDGRIVGEGFFNGTIRPFALKPVCNGKFEVYGIGCAGATETPALRGYGCPTPNEPFAIEITHGGANAQGLLFLGGGAGVAPIVPTCAVQILPLLPLTIPVVLDPAGGLFFVTELPAGTPSFDVWLQSFLADGSVLSGIRGTQPLKLHFQ